MAKNTEQGFFSKADAKPQDSTTRIPMVDIEAAIKVVTDIRERALETSPMDDVAKALGYSSATSTPFYRRIAAARQFNLLSSKSSLTQDAVDYIRPHDEEMKQRILTKAIRGITGYDALLERYANKKLSIEMVKNSIAKENNLTDGCALICAKAFEASLVFARMISSDGIVSPTLVVPLENRQDPLKNNGAKDHKPSADPGRNKDVDISTKDTHEHTIFLDKDKSRSFEFTGPLEITRTEYNRICKWLEFTMLITEEKAEGQ